MYKYELYGETILEAHSKMLMVDFSGKQKKYIIFLNFLLPIL